MSESFTNTKRRRVKDPSQHSKLRKPLIILSVLMLLFACYTVIRSIDDDASVEIVPKAADYGDLTETRALERFGKAYLDANGGLEYLQTLQTLRLEGTVSSEEGETNFFILKRRPDMMLMTNETEGRKITIGHADGQYWGKLTQPNGEVQSIDIPEEKSKDYRPLLPMFGPLLSAYLDDECQVESITESTYNGQEVLEIITTSRFFANPITVWVDPSNLTVLAHSTVRSDGTEQMSEFSDFRKVQKVTIPHKIVTSEGGIEKSSITIEGPAFNIGVSSHLFQRKENE